MSKLKCHRELFLNTRMTYRCNVTEEKLKKWREEFKVPDDFVAELPMSKVQPNTQVENGLIMNLTHFSHGFRLPICYEFRQILNFYGLVPAQLVPNTIRNLMAYIVFLRLNRIVFSMNVFRHMFSGRGRDGGFISFYSNVFKAAGLENKVPAWAKEFFVVKVAEGGDHSFGVPLTPVDLKPAFLVKPKLTSEEQDLINFLRGKWLDCNYYVSPDIMAIALGDSIVTMATALRQVVPVDEPVILPVTGEWISAHEAKRLNIAAQRKGKKAEDPDDAIEVSAESEPSPSEPPSKKARVSDDAGTSTSGAGTSKKGEERKYTNPRTGRPSSTPHPYFGFTPCIYGGAPFLDWDKKNMRVSLPLDLPGMIIPKRSGSAGKDIGYALTGETDYLYMRAMDPEQFSGFVSQHCVGSLVAASFLGRRFDNLLVKFDNLEASCAKKDEELAELKLQMEAKDKENEELKRRLEDEEKKVKALALSNTELEAELQKARAEPSDKVSDEAYEKIVGEVRDSEEYQNNLDNMLQTGVRLCSKVLQRKGFALSSINEDDLIEECMDEYLN